MGSQQRWLVAWYAVLRLARHVSRLSCQLVAQSPAAGAQAASCELPRATAAIDMAMTCRSFR